MLLVDPPYNVDYKGRAGKIMNDSMEDVKFREFLRTAFCHAEKALKPGAPFYIFHADSEGYNFRGACHDIGLKVRQCLVWKKNALVLGRQDYQWIHEPCLYGWKDGGGHKWHGGRKVTTVVDLAPEYVEKTEDGYAVFTINGRMFRIKADQVAEIIETSVIPFDRPIASKLHPTMKPVGLYVKLIENSTDYGDVVLDVFGGSGTTLIACEKTGRVCRMMEMDEHYCDVIRKRWAEYVHGEGCDWEKLTPEIENKNERKN